jgi:hypothetical protein
MVEQALTLLPDGKASGDSAWKCIEEMVKDFRIGRDWIVARLSKLDFPTEKRPNRIRESFADIEYFHPGAVAEIRRQAKEWKSIPPLGRAKTLTQAADWLGMSIRTIELISQREGIPILRRRSQNNRVVKCLPLESCRKIKAFRGETAPPGWENTHTISQITGWPEGTIESRLRKAGFNSQRCIAPANGHEAVFYSPEAIAFLGYKSTGIPAGDWMTMTRMAALLGRTLEWMRPRLARYKDTLYAQWRLTDTGESRLHYAPVVFRTLKAESIKNRLAA